MVKVGLYFADYLEFGGGWNIHPPLGLGYLVSYTRKFVDGVDFVVKRDIDELIKEKPDIVGISYVTHTARLAGRQARKVKAALGCPVLAGGPHISTLPMNLEEGFDLAVISEGEVTFAELMALYLAEGRFAPQSLAKVQGIVYRDGDGQVQKTGPRPYIQDLDSIPYADRDLMFEQWRRPKVEMQIMTSRGCPYQCAFCSTIIHWGQKYRHHSNDYVVTELAHLRERFNPEMIHFYDDLFIVQKQRTLKLLRLIRERRLHEGIEFTCFVRSNLLDDEIMASFAQTNFKILNVGFESGSDAVLKTFNKQSVDVAMHHKAIELARLHGIQYTSCFILGAPGETRQDILDTFSFVTENIDTLISVHLVPLMVFPGTKVWEWAQERGASEGNLDGIALDLDDFENMDFITKKWYYFNEKKIPRDEMITYLQMGTRLEEVVAKYHANDRHNRAIGTIAENVPIMEIMKEKARKRFRKFMPSE